MSNISQFLDPSIYLQTLTGDAGGAIGPDGAGNITIAGGTNIATTGAGSTVTINIDGVVAVGNGGSGAGTFTDFGVLVGSGTGAFTALAVGTNGQVLIGATGADPAFATITSTGGTIAFTLGVNTLNLEASAVSAVVDSHSGFNSWDGGSPYFDDTVLGDFTLSQSGTGFINGVAVSWTAPQTATGMTAGNTYYIYIDNAGNIQKTTTRTNALYQNNIVLFECMRDSTAAANIQVTVKDNHSYLMPPETASYLHAVVGTVIANVNNGANILLDGTQKIAISGADELEDHGLETDIADSGGTGVTWKQYFTLGSGKWAQNSSTDTFVGEYNSGGSATALGGNKFGIYTLYVSKDNLNASTPTYFAVLDDAQYNNLGAAQTVIANGTNAQASNELDALEVAQLGYIIFAESSTSIVDVIIAKETLRSTISSSGTNLASLVLTDVTNFGGILSSADTTVQASLDTLDDWGAGATDHAVMIGSGTNTALSATAVGATGEVLVGATGADPTWSGSPSVSGTVTAATGMTITANDLAISSGKITMPTTTSADGQITINGTHVFHTYGTNNTFVGSNSGNFTLSTSNSCVGVGVDSLNALTTGDENVAIGYLAMNSATSTSYNVAIGQNCLSSVTTLGGAIPGRNTAIGRNALNALVTGGRNLALGYEAGISYTGTESNNCLIYNSGTITDANTIRIGTQGAGNGQQDTTFIAGIYGVTPGGTQNLALIDSNHQLGSATITDGVGISTTLGAGTLTIQSTATTVKTETGASYTIVLADAGKYIKFNRGTAQTITIPPDATTDFPIGTSIGFEQMGAGQTTFTGAIPPTLNSADAALTTVKQFSVGYMIKTAANLWTFGGDLEA